MDAAVQRRRLRLRTKLLLVCSLMLLLVVLACLTVYGVQRRWYLEEQYEQMNVVVSQSMAALEAQLRALDGQSMRFVTGRELQDNLERYANSRPEEANAYQLKLSYALSLNFPATAQYSNAALITGGQRAVVAVISERTAFDRDTVEQMFRSAEGAMGRQLFMFSPQQQDTLLLYRIVRKTHNLDLSTLGLFVLSVRMDEWVQRNMPAVGEAGQLLILDGARTIHGDHALAAQLPGDLRDGSYSMAQLGGQRMMLCASSSRTMGWRFVYLIAQADMQRRADALLAFAAAFVGVLAFAVFATMLNLSLQVTRPVNRTMNRIRAFQEELALETPLLPAGMGELEALESSVDAMQRQLRALIHDNYEVRLSQREAELKALQMQINPHFINNTLNTVLWASRLEGGKITYRVIDALRRLLHERLTFEKPEWSLNDEKRLLEDYLDIQRIRFEGRLDARMAFPEETLGLAIPKLCLQPLLENAISHGVQMNAGVTRVSVSALLSGERLALTVEDDGPGIPAETLQALRERRYVSHSTGIGMANIQDRLRLLYGDDGRMEIASEPGRGTKITLTLPARAAEG